MNEPIITLTLPSLPSANEAVLLARGNRFQAATATAQWRMTAKLTGLSELATRSMVAPRLSRARVVLTSYPPSRRKDLVNLYFKAALDGFQDCGIFANDRGIEELTIRFGGVDKTHPRVVVDVYQIEETAA